MHLPFLDWQLLPGITLLIAEACTRTVKNTCVRQCR